MASGNRDQQQTPYLDAWLAYRDAGIVSYSTPGHKGGRGMPPEIVGALGLAALALDIPNAGGVDDTHSSRGYLRQAEDLAAAAWSADQAIFLVNGSTTGNQAFLLAACRPGDEVVIARNIHKSLLVGLILSGVRPIYVHPAIDPATNLGLDVSVEDIRDALDAHPAARAVVLVSPAYSGVSSNLPPIAALCRDRGVPLFVDEAWGPHFPFHPALPPSAMQSGATAAVTSIHKLLPGITQASLLTLRGPLVERGPLEAAVSMIQTTSPAALIYASIDACRRWMALHGKDLLQRTLQLAAMARAAIEAIDGIDVVGPEVIQARPGAAFDPTRLLIDVHRLGITGFQAEKILRERYRIGVEMSDLVSVIAMLTVGDDEQSVEHLLAGLRGLAADVGSGQVAAELPESLARRSSGSVLRSAAPLMTPREAALAPAKAVPLSQATSRIAAEMITPYPPGIPVVAPGEVISAEIVDYLQTALAAGMYISGPADRRLETVRVVASA